MRRASLAAGLLNRSKRALKVARKDAARAKRMAFEASLMWDAFAEAASRAVMPMAGPGSQDGSGDPSSPGSADCFRATQTPAGLASEQLPAPASAPVPRDSGSTEPKHGQAS